MRGCFPDMQVADRRAIDDRIFTRHTCVQVHYDNYDNDVRGRTRVRIAASFERQGSLI